MYEITPPRPADAAPIHELLDVAFGPDRRSGPAHALRRDTAAEPHLALVARSGGRIVGTIQYWPVLIGEAAGALLLGPLAVAAPARRLGIGACLTWQSLDLAAWAGHRMVLLVGEPAYYARFGFGPVAGGAIVIPGTAGRLLGKGLVRHAFAGVSGAVRAWRWVRRRLRAPLRQSPPRPATSRSQISRTAPSPPWRSVT